MATDYIGRLAEESLHPRDPKKKPLLQKALEIAFETAPTDAVDLAAKLEARPHVQATLASLTGYTPSQWLLDQELEQVAKRRKKLGIEAEVPTKTATPTETAYDRAKKSGLMGLCFSGGGIRSASFNLGVLQGLAELDLLKYFDYLSSVSGGGYIHQWLVAWSKRCSFTEVTKQLIPLPEKDNPGTHPEQIRWLRRFSNYLTPQTGLLSADTWVAFATWLRNTLLNQIILISGMLFLILLPHIVAFEALVPHKPPAAAALLGAISALWLLASFVLGRNLWLLRGPGADEQSCAGQGAVQRWIVAPMLVSTLLLAMLMRIVLAVPAGIHLALVFAGGTALLLVLALAIIFGGAAPLSFLKSYQETAHFDEVSAFWKQQPKCVGHAKFVIAAGLLVGAGFFSAVFGASWITACIALVANVWKYLPHHWWRLDLVALPPLFMGGSLITMLFVLGLLGRTFSDARREWMARLAGWIGLYSLMWLLFSGFSLFGHAIVEWLVVSYPKGKFAVLLSWLAVLIKSVLAANDSKSRGASDDKAPSKFGVVEAFAIVGPYVFIVGLALVLSWCADELLGQALFAGAWWVFLVFFVPLLICGLFAWRVDVNEFSLHAFYRNRLARCYLGAANLDRRPNPFTGLDEADAAIAIADLLPVADRNPHGQAESGVEIKKGYDGPFPIFCAALNLTFGEDLAWQERKAASFVFTPLYTGYDVGWTAARGKNNLRFNGYVKTSTYAYPPEGVHISTAVAISGAAVSPNWGYHTNPATSFLLTVFNARLGWWIRNPRKLTEDGRKLPRSGNSADRADGKFGMLVGRNRYPKPSPHFSLFRLISELLGQANDTSNYVYLTDGAHFENMGLYELVRRRCRHIVICDAEEDGQLQFGGIGMAIRKCRIDFGVEITLDLRPLEHVSDTQLSSAHCVSGTIFYPEDPEHPGTVVYIKSSLTGDEPADIVNYKEHASFPHDTTGNQWFTESQFESYRRLGHHIAYSAFEPAAPRPNPEITKSPSPTKPVEPIRLSCSTLEGRSKYFSNLRHIWSAPTPEMDRYNEALIARYDALLGQVRTDANLPGFFDLLFKRSEVAWKKGRTDQEVDYAVRFSLELIEFMWAVFTELNLVLPEKRNHPAGRGWCLMFAEWVQIDVVRDAWQRYRLTFSQRFRDFVESREVGLSHGATAPTPTQPNTHA